MSWPGSLWNAGMGAWLFNQDPTALARRALELKQQQERERQMRSMAVVIAAVLVAWRLFRR